MLKALFAQLAALASFYANTVRAGVVLVRKATCIVDVGTLEIGGHPSRDIAAFSVPARKVC